MVVYIIIASREPKCANARTCRYRYKHWPQTRLSHAGHCASTGKAWPYETRPSSHCHYTPTLPSAQPCGRLSLNTSVCCHMFTCESYNIMHIYCMITCNLIAHTFAPWHTHTRTHTHHTHRHCMHACSHTLTCCLS